MVHTFDIHFVRSFKNDQLHIAYPNVPASEHGKCVGLKHKYKLFEEFNV